MHFLYSLGLALLLALTSPLWLLRMVRQGKYRAGLAERFGRVPRRLVASHTPTRTIWVHAVSVGEVLAVYGLVQGIRKQFPDWRVVVSTTTATGQKLARDKFGAENVFYFPLDFSFAIRPYLRALRPELIVLAETEFWPNFLRLGMQSGAKVAVVNARISDRSLPRYRALRRLVRPVLSNISAFLAQTPEDARRLIEIGADPARVGVSGNLKFDVKLPEQMPIVERMQGAFLPSASRKGGAPIAGDRGPVIVCGSTVEGEESLVIDAFRHVLAEYSGAVMVLAPRHPERFAAVSDLVRAPGLRWWRRSGWSGEPLCGGVFLLDTIGELASVYGLADIAFVGGSLVPRGGHNVLEPAYFARPIVIGPHTENFRDIIALFRQADALVVANDGAELAECFMALLADHAGREALGQNGAAVLRQHAGATARTLQGIQELLDEPVPSSQRVSPAGPNQRAALAEEPSDCVGRVSDPPPDMGRVPPHTTVTRGRQ